MRHNTHEEIIHLYRRRLNYTKTIQLRIHLFWVFCNLPKSASPAWNNVLHSMKSVAQLLIWLSWFLFGVGSFFNLSRSLANTPTFPHILACLPWNSRCFSLCQYQQFIFRIVEVTLTSEGIRSFCDMAAIWISFNDTWSNSYCASHCRSHPANWIVCFFCFSRNHFRLTCSMKTNKFLRPCPRR